MKIGSLCSGYGGLEMAVAEVYGGELAWVSDIDKGACKILAHRYPDVPNIGDMTAVDWSAVEPVDILCGGTPCQDLSHAGKRAGMTEGTRSNLWVAMREAIATIRPGLVVWENVGGAASAEAASEVEPCSGCVGDGSRVLLRALGRVVGDLSSLGYVGRVHALRAADVGAPHGRLRYFLAATDADRDGPQVVRWLDPVGRDAHRRDRADGPRAAGEPASRLLKTPTSQLAINGGSQHPDKRKAGGHGPTLADEVEFLLPTPMSRDYRTGYADGKSAPGREGGRPLNDVIELLPTTSWGEYAAAIERWEAELGRPAPAPTQTSRKGNPQLAPAFVEWLMGLPAGWVTDVPGITRNEALKALGNGVVPQQAAEALRVMASWSEVAA